MLQPKRQASAGLGRLFGNRTCHAHFARISTGLTKSQNHFTPLRLPTCLSAAGRGRPQPHGPLRRPKPQRICPKVDRQLCILEADCWVQGLPVQLLGDLQSKSAWSAQLCARQQCAVWLWWLYLGR